MNDKNLTLELEKNFFIEKVFKDDSHVKVFLAFDKIMKRKVILKKVYFKTPNEKKLVMDEMNNHIVLEKECEFIPTIYNAYFQKDCIIIEMQYIQGESLADYIAATNFDNKGYNWHSERIALYKKIVAVVAQLHKNSYFIHKDLNPRNIIIKKGKDFQPYVIDFGISGPTLNKGVGTNGYMPPEQRFSSKSHEIKQSADVYSLGMIGLKLFSKDGSFENLDLKDYKTLEEILKKSISENPEERYNNAFSMQLALRKVYERRKK